MTTQDSRSAVGANGDLPTSVFGEWRRFLSPYLRHPHIVGAIAPSSAALARAMLKGAEPLEGPVLELGGGTGVFSRAVLQAGLAPGALHIVERLPEFARALRTRLPDTRVLELDAAQLQASLFTHPPAIVLSGLPLRAMAEAHVETLLRAVLGCCRQDVRIVQFSYGVRCPVSTALRARLGLQAQRLAWVAANLPPAWVWRLQRSGLPAE